MTTNAQHIAHFSKSTHQQDLRLAAKAYGVTVAELLAILDAAAAAVRANKKEA